MIREITISELEDVSGGNEAACAASATLGAGAALAGTTALVPGAHSPFAGFTAAVMGVGAAGFGLFCVFG